MSDRKTVAIIGAGMAGLAAALRLCAEGVAVHLFEANGKVGGCCATTRVGGYTFNDGAIYLAMPSMLDHLFAVLGLDRTRLLPLHQIANLQTAIVPDGTIVDITSGPDVATVSLRDAAASDRLQEEVTRFLRQWEPTLRFFTDDILVHPLSLLHFLARGWRHVPKLRGTAASQLRQSFTNDAVRAALGGALLYAGAPPDKLPAASLLGLAAMLRDGYFLPEGGMGRLPEVMGEAVRAHGGHLHLHSAVRRILVKRGRAYAIDVENGGVIGFGAVISTLSAMHTYGALLRDAGVPAHLRRKVQRAPLSLRGLVLQLGLANRIEARSHVHCVLPWLRDQGQVFLPRAGDMRWSTYTVPTLTLPDLAPAGGSVVEMFPAIRQDLAPDAWSEARKEEVTAQALEWLRRDHTINVAASRVLSPKEFQDQAHLHAGALYGIAPAAGPAALFKHRTPIRGLYQAGQTTWPGFGVIGAGMSGVFAAEALMRDARL
jgi:phytoene desaturase